MNNKLKIASNNVLNIEKAKKFEDRTEDEKKVIVNYTVWEQLLLFIERFGEKTEIDSGIVIIRTTDGDVRSDGSNMTEEEFISTLEEAKQRFYFNKFMGDIL